jgi:hypothetical protein
MIQRSAKGKDGKEVRLRAKQGGCSRGNLRICRRKLRYAESLDVGCVMLIRRRVP